MIAASAIFPIETSPAVLIAAVQPASLREKFAAIPHLEPDRVTNAHPRVLESNGFCVIEFRGSAGQVIPVRVKNQEVAEYLLAYGTWHPDPPGKEKRLRHNRRDGKKVKTVYAHRLLFDGMSSNEVAAGRKCRPKPRDGNYFNLTPENFEPPKPRNAEQMVGFFALVLTIWGQMCAKAKRALRDELKADDAISAAIEQVTDALVAGSGTFLDDQKFNAWVFKVLEAHIRQRQSKRGALGDLVLGKKEKEFRAFPANTTSSGHSAGEDETVRDNDWEVLASRSAFRLDASVESTEWSETAVSLLTEDE